MTRIGYIQDNLPDEDYDPSEPRMGFGGTDVSCDRVPAVRQPIGFMRRKVRVRVKAWTQPVLESNQ